MIPIIKDNKDTITSNVMSDLEGRDAANIENLKTFYFKILTEDNIRTSSFRYVYAKVAFEVICNYTNDMTSLEGFNKFNRDKVNIEIANPVTAKEVYEKPKKVAVEGTKFGMSVKTSQFKI
jgi:hypothetical protein